MANDDRWPTQVRPFQWPELEARRPEPPTAPPSNAAKDSGSTEPDRESVLAEVRQEAEGVVAAARCEADGIREAARREGLEAGAEEGGRRLRAAADHLLAVAEALSGFKAGLYEEARSQVVELALALVGKVMGPLAEGDAETVARVTGHALAALSDRETLTLRVNPDDLQSLLEAKPRLLQTLDGIKKLTVLEDHSVGRGGCLVETPTAEIDARLETQLQELSRTLKKPG